MLLKLPVEKTVDLLYFSSRIKFDFRDESDCCKSPNRRNSFGLGVFPASLVPLKWLSAGTVAEAVCPLSTLPCEPALIHTHTLTHTHTRGTLLFVIIHHEPRIELVPVTFTANASVIENVLNSRTELAG